MIRRYLKHEYSNRIQYDYSTITQLAQKVFLHTKSPLSSSEYEIIEKKITIKCC